MSLTVKPSSFAVAETSRRAGKFLAAHVNQVEVKRFATWLAILGRPVAVGFFVNLESCGHSELTFSLLFSVMSNWLPIADGGTAGNWPTIL